MNAAQVRAGRALHVQVAWRTDAPHALDDVFFDLELALIRFEIQVRRAQYEIEREMPELVDLGGEGGES